MTSVIFNVHRCFFCNSEMMSVRIWQEGDDEAEADASETWHAVVCEECGAQGPRQTTAEDAVQAWNCGESQF